MEFLGLLIPFILFGLLICCIDSPTAAQAVHRGNPFSIQGGTRRRFAAPSFGPAAMETAKILPVSTLNLHTGSKWLAFQHKVCYTIQVKAEATASHPATDGQRGFPYKALGALC